jgi:hypothetical protein
VKTDRAPIVESYFFEPLSLEGFAPGAGPVGGGLSSIMSLFPAA